VTWGNSGEDNELFDDPDAPPVDIDESEFDESEPSPDPPVPPGDSGDGSENAGVL
jgi:hypothetical protein